VLERLLLASQELTDDYGIGRQAAEADRGPSAHPWRGAWRHRRMPATLLSGKVSVHVEADSSC